MTTASIVLLNAVAIVGLIPWTLVAAEADAKKLPTYASSAAEADGKTPPGCTNVSPQVLLEAHLLDAPAGATRKALEGILPAANTVTLLSGEQATRFLDKLQAANGVSILCTPTVVTMVGRPATIQIGCVPPGNSAVTDADFEGLTLHVLPERKDRDLMVKIDAQRRMRVPGSAGPTFQETRIDTRLAVAPGQTALVAGREDNGKEFVMLISMSVVSEGRDRPERK